MERDANSLKLLCMNPYQQLKYELHVQIFIGHIVLREFSENR